MAADWIKMRIDLQTHPKVVRILSATMADKFRVIGGLHAVWAIFDTHSVDGILNGYSPSILDHLIGWDGFSQAMIDVKWLSFDGENLTVPEFEEHNGASGKRRAEDQKRKKKSRERPDSVRKVSADVSANPPDKLRTRGEREDIDQEQELPPSSPKAKKAATKGTRLPDDWMPDHELIAQVTAESGDLWKRELPKFKDYWPAQPGQRGVKLDWRGTFRNWVRKAAESQPRYGPRQQQPSRQAAIAEALLRDSRYADTAARQPGLALPHRDRRPADAHAAVAAVSAGPGHDPGDGDGLDLRAAPTRPR
jgi:hypothetical protein